MTETSETTAIVVVPGPEKRNTRNGLASLAYLVVVLWGISAAREFLIPLCLAGLLSFMVLPVIRFLVARRVPNWLAVTLGTLLLLLPFILGGYVVVRQGQSLVLDFPRISEMVGRQVEKFATSDFAHRFHLEDSVSLAAIAERLRSSASESAQFVMTGLRAVLETGSQIALVFIFTVLMVALRDHLRRSAERLLARFENVHSANMLDAVVSLIEQFLLARMLVCVVVTLLSWVALAVLGIPYGLLLSVFVGLMTVLPEVGFVLSLVPIVIVAAATGHTLFSVSLAVLAQFCIHLVEANVFTPKLVGHKLNINVLASFIGLFGGGLIWGVWGMFLSVPILGVMKIVLGAAPSLQPWSELLSEREDRALTRQIIKRSKLPLFFKSRRTPVES